MSTIPGRVLVGCLILLAQSVPAGAQREVAISLHCSDSPCRFQQGEVIHLQLEFTAANPGYAVRDSRQVGDGLSVRDMGWESFTATPSACVADPLEGSTIGMNGTGIFGTPPLVPGKPFSILVELNQWLRFGCPGKYRIAAQSTRAYRTANAPAGLQHPEAIGSEPLDIEIVPADPEWQKEQLARIVPALPRPGAGYSAEAKAAVRVLSYLGSDAALREIRKHVSEAPMALEFRQQNGFYLLEWEMARLELVRRAAAPPHR